MLDLFNIPSNTDSTKIFYASGGTTSWQTWIKPRNAKFIQMFCLGSGGGGGGGALQVAGTTAASGGGGAASGFMRVIYPASLLPDILYVQVGTGGVGGAGATVAGQGVAGGSGVNSIISIVPSTNTIGIIARSNNTAPGGGSAAGIGGSVPTIYSVLSFPFTQLGIYNIVVGLVGIAGNVGTTALLTTLVTGGAGGGNKPVNSQSAGGSILPASAILTNTVNGGAVGGGIGGDGYGSMYPFCGTGGAGGGGNLTGNGGRGGNGFYGSGGGGGGGGLVSGTSFTGGRGGNGGDGLVIITTIT